MIKRIELVNFMSHRHTVIEPADGLTVLVGPNNCGKSAVVAALQILCHNENSTYVTRHGEKDCSITVETDDGHVVQWQRKRSSITYTIDGKLYDRLRGSVPEELHDVLRLPKVALDNSPDQFDIHFGQQKEPVFLLNESGRAAAGFFAASSDASRLIQMQKLHGQRVRNANRELKRTLDESDQLETHIEKLQSVPELNERLLICEQQRIDIEAAYQQIERRRTTVQQIRQQQFSLLRLSLRSKHLSKLTTAPQLHPVVHLDQSIQSISSMQTRLKQLTNFSSALTRTIPPPLLHDTKNLAAAIRPLRLNLARNRKIGAVNEAFDKLQSPPVLEDSNALRSLLSELAGLTNRRDKLIAKGKQIEADVQLLNGEIEDWLATNPSCPTCRQELTKEHVLKYSSQGCSDENE